MSIFTSMMQAAAQITFAFHSEPAVVKPGTGSPRNITICRTTSSVENASVTVGKNRKEILSFVASKEDMEDVLPDVDQITVDGKDWTVNRIEAQSADTELVTVSRTVKVQTKRDGYQGNS